MNIKEVYEMANAQNVKMWEVANFLELTSKELNTRMRFGISTADEKVIVNAIQRISSMDLQKRFGENNYSHYLKRELQNLIYEKESNLNGERNEAISILWASYIGGYKDVLEIMERDERNGKNNRLE